MELNTRITLLSISQDYGSSGDDIIKAEKTVWAAALPPSVSLKFKAEAASRSVDIVIYLWRREYDTGDYNYCEVRGVRYRIESDGAGMNDEYIKLIAVRG